jgi:hypothetical protein
VAQFNEGFKLFFELKAIGADFTVLNARIPEIERPVAIDEDGVLTIRGAYRDPPPVTFEQTYVKEDGRWKLLGFHVNLANVADWAPNAGGETP